MDVPGSLAATAEWSPQGAADCRFKSVPIGVLVDTDGLRIGFWRGFNLDRESAMLQRGRFGRSELKAVGRRLRLHRVAKGWSLRRLSEVSGVSVAAIRKVELGESNPGLLTILALLEALDKPVDRLIGEIAERERSIHLVRAGDCGRAAGGAKTVPLSAGLGRAAMAGRHVRLEAGETLSAAGGRPMFGYVLDGTVRVDPVEGAVETCGEGDAFHLLSLAHGAVHGGPAGARLVLVDQAAPA